MAVSDLKAKLIARIAVIEARIAAGTAPVEEAEFGSDKKRVKYSPKMREDDIKYLKELESQLSQFNVVNGGRSLVINSGY